MRYWITLLLIITGASLAVPEGVTPEPLGTQLLPICMTRYGTPTKLSLALGVSFNKRTGHSSFRGFILQVEPGFGGGKLSAGYRIGELHILPIWSLGLSASLLRTWENPLGDVEPDQSYLGLELNASFSVIGLSGGAFMHIAGDDEENDWIFSFGAGVGI